MKNFADRLLDTITEKNSFLLAGWDPRMDSIPQCYFELAATSCDSNASLIRHVLVNFYTDALLASKDHIVAVKPNIAFFEALGIPGLRAFNDLCSILREHNVINIVDGKRGDIGSTAEAYSKAYLGTEIFNADALTVNPYLGLDTIESYLDHCVANGKGIYVLVKTSNPGSKDFQNLKLINGTTLAEEVAVKIQDLSQKFIGEHGVSAIGAVVGATYPIEATNFRKLMPNCPFLIPGYGTQGASSADAVASFNSKTINGIVNSSRGLFSSFKNLKITREECKLEIYQKAIDAKNDLMSAFRQIKN